MGSWWSTKIPQHVGTLLPRCFRDRVRILKTQVFCSLLHLPTSFVSCSESLLSRYVVDAADHDNLSVSKSELHDLLSKSSLNGIPLLVLGNKIDKPGALSKEALTDEMYVNFIWKQHKKASSISSGRVFNIFTFVIAGGFSRWQIEKSAVSWYPARTLPISIRSLIGLSSIQNQRTKNFTKNVYFHQERLKQEFVFIFLSCLVWFGPVLSLYIRCGFSSIIKHLQFWKQQIHKWLAQFMIIF